MRLTSTARFARDVRRATRHGKDLGKLWGVVEALQSGVKLAACHRPHRLSDRWSEHWECHIEPDWLLIWTYGDKTLILVRTGTHADLFG